MLCKSSQTFMKMVHHWNDIIKPLGASKNLWFMANMLNMEIASRQTEPTARSLTRGASASAIDSRLSVGCGNLISLCLFSHVVNHRYCTGKQMEWRANLKVEVSEGKQIDLRCCDTRGIYWIFLISHHCKAFQSLILVNDDFVDIFNVIILF